jgi:hypothetical protein
MAQQKLVKFGMDVVPLVSNEDPLYNNDNNNQWHYSRDGRKPPLMRFHSLS